MKNLTELNNGLNTIDGILNTQNTNKQTGITEALKVIGEKIAEYSHTGLVGRKARKAVKMAVLSELEGESNKSMLRAYTIAFNIVFREIDIKIDLLTVAQVENLSRHGAVADINALYTLDADYQDGVKGYLKTLKTRETIVKTFEKAGKAQK